MRGQAFVVYDSIDDARNAMGLLQNFLLYGKAIRISFARETSHVILKREGMLIPEGNDAEKSARFFERLRKKLDEDTAESPLPANGIITRNLSIYCGDID